jgi:hypothetical protein
MADSEGEENTMHTEQSRLVRQSMEATAHPDVYARRKTAALGAVLARTDVPLASAEKVVEVVLDAVETQDLVTEHRERIAEACTCPTTPRDADGNCDLIEQDDCPVHGDFIAREGSPILHRPGLPDSADTRLQGYEIGYRNGESSMLADIDTACDQLGIEYEGHPLTALRGMADIGRRREGWRGRLAHVEVLLAKSEAGFADDGPLSQALAELRALIDEA